MPQEIFFTTDTPTNAIRLFVLCKHDLYFSILASLIKEHLIECSAICNEPTEAVNEFIKSGADIVVLDANWTNRGYLVTQITEMFFKYQNDLKIIFVSTMYDPSIAEKAKILKGKGYFARTGEIQYIIDCIKKVSQNETCFS